MPHSSVLLPQLAVQLLLICTAATGQVQLLFSCLYQF